MTFSMIIQADTLQDALDPVLALVDECKLRLGEDGLSITAVDPANVAMVDLAIDATACAHYDADGGVIGINLDRFSDVVGMADSDDMIRLDLNAETRKLDIEIGGLEFTLACINPDSIRQEPDMPDLDLEADYTVEGRTLDRGVTAADLCSDHIELVGEVAVLVIQAQGDTDDVTETVDGGRLLAADHSGAEPVSSLFSLDYLDDMVGPMGSDTEVDVTLGAEMPVTLAYEQAEGDVHVEHMLAPRVQNDGGGA